MSIIERATPQITHKTDLDPILLVERTPDNPTCKSKRRASNPVAIKGLAHRLVIHRPMTSLSRDATVEMSTKLDRTLNSKLHAEVWSGQGRPLSSLKASLKPLSPVKRSQGHARRQHGARNRPVVGKRNDTQGAAGFRYTNGENEYTTEAHGKRHHFVVEALPASLWDPILVV